MIIYIILCVSKMCNKSLKITYIKYKKWRYFRTFWTFSINISLYFYFASPEYGFQMGDSNSLWLRFYIHFISFVSRDFHRFIFILFCVCLCIALISFAILRHIFLHTSTNYICCCIWSSNSFHFISFKNRKTLIFVAVAVVVYVCYLSRLLVVFLTRTLLFFVYFVTY